MDSTACDNKDASLLLAQFYKSLVAENSLDDTSLNLKIISNLINAGFNVNQTFPDKFFIPSKPEIFEVSNGISGGTALDFVYIRKLSMNIFNSLLEHKADFTVKNSNGETVLHRLIETWRREYTEELKAKLLEYINAILSSHIKYHITSNPSDNDGFSHFHCACLVNHTESVKFFLKNGICIDQATKMDSKFYGSFTGLHFAAESSNIETVEILLNNKADPLIKNWRGMTPLMCVIENKLKLFQDLQEHVEYNILLQNMENNEKIINLFLEKNYSPTISFYAACSLKDISWVERILEHVPDINHPISMDSLQWPGWTGLHFAAYCNIEMVKLLFEKGGNIVAEDANGVTPLNICLSNYNNKFEDICSLLSNNSTWSNTLMSDGKTKVLDLIKNMNNAYSLRSFINEKFEDVNSIIPVDSPFWPGYTCLHMAVVILKPDWSNSNLINTEIIRILLNYNANVNSKNRQGQTPIHLAFRLNKHISILLEHLESLPAITDIRDNDDLSYLHIACTHNSKRLIEKLLPTSDVNLKYKGRFIEYYFANTGWTALHFAITTSDSTIKLLLDNGANIEAKDAFSMTPIHWIFREDKADILSKHPDLKDLTTHFGLNYLHAAAYANNEAAVMRLISMGSDISAVMDCKEHYLVNDIHSHFLNLSGLTPLETALQNQSFKAFSGFLKSGINLSIDDYKWTQILETNIIFDAFRYNAYWNDDDLRKNIEREIGLTRLHVACYTGGITHIKMLLEEGVNVNARIHVNSKAFSGFTPLHMLIKFSYRHDRHNKNKQRFMFTRIKMFLERGADITITNGEGNTPLHVFLKLAERDDGTVKEAEECTTLLMSSQQDFSINPVNTDGISHFHVACLIHNVEAVEGFLNHGVDVNQPIDLFYEKYAKCTPLHLAFRFPLTKFLRNQSPSVVVNLLLKYGADVNAQDACGNTPMHEACRDARANVDILASLISLGADVKIKNVRGETPFEILISSPDVLDEQIRLFIKHGSGFNDWNPLSGKCYMGIFIFVNAAQPQTIATRLMRYSNETMRDEMDRTIIHNIVSIFKTTHRLQSTYIEIIKMILEKGIEVDVQDNSGKTALHYAAQFGNVDAAVALLELGADIDIVDKTGKSALSYAFERSMKMDDTAVSDSLFMTTSVRKILGLEVSQFNQNLIDEIERDGCVGSLVAQWLYYENDSEIQFAIQTSKNLSVASNSITLYDFLSNDKAVVNYMHTPKKIRDEIDKFFKSFDVMHFIDAVDVYVILRSQYSKALARIPLFKEASFSLRNLLGFSFPGLCEDILIYLSNSELKNVIKSTID